jgi:hypothetical protein
MTLQRIENALLAELNVEANKISLMWKVNKDGALYRLVYGDDVHFSSRYYEAILARIDAILEQRHGDPMTLTPTRAADLIPGNADIFDVIDFGDLDRWKMSTYQFTAYLLTRNIKPCGTCGIWANGVCDCAERSE